MERATPPFFVVGCPRSGTKMFRELLNASPEIWISDIESGFIPRFTRQIGRYGDLERPENFTRLAEALAATRAFWHWQRRGVHIDARRWYERCGRYDWPGVLEGLFRCVYEQELPDASVPFERLVWGDKTPLYVTQLPVLAAVFPHARFVHIVRDARDCVLSAEQAWGNSPLRTAQEWADQVARCRADGHALGAARYHELRYEDLLADVTGTLAAVFGFLGVPTPADAGRLLRVPENVGAARGERQVVAGNREKWKSRMTPALRRHVEAVCGVQLERLGYEREYPDEPERRVSPLALRAYRARDAWRQLAFRRRELGGWWEGLRFLLTRRERV